MLNLFKSRDIAKKGFDSIVYTLHKRFGPYHMAHRLTKQFCDPPKCTFIHGHTINIDIDLIFELDRTEFDILKHNSGMLIDFTYLKEYIHKPFNEWFDHTLIVELENENHVPEGCNRIYGFEYGESLLVLYHNPNQRTVYTTFSPTAELMSLWIARWLEFQLHTNVALKDKFVVSVKTIQFIKVTFWETEKNSATVTLSVQL